MLDDEYLHVLVFSVYYLLFLINSELIDDIAMQIVTTSVAEVLIKHYIIYCSVCYVPRNLQVVIGT